jgi:hypothetical protein
MRTFCRQDNNSSSFSIFQNGGEIQKSAVSLPIFIQHEDVS